MHIKANGIGIEVEDSGPGNGAPRPVVLLVMGLGMQLVAWPPALVRALVDAGYRVIRHDNRDIGLSQHLDHLGPPNLVWTMVKHKLHASIRPPYSLADMAQDALGLLDALGVDKAHVVGVSMGGMIAQRMAIAAPQRLLSLTSIMSSSGARGLPEATPKVRRVLRGSSSDRGPGGPVAPRGCRASAQLLFASLGVAACACARLRPLLSPPDQDGLAPGPARRAAPAADRSA